MSITLQQATADLVLSRALEETKISWPNDLNVMQNFGKNFHYGSLHAFELTLPPKMWKDTENYIEIADKFIHYNVNLDVYSAPRGLLEKLIGTMLDWHKLPAHELHLWRRISG